MKTGRNIIIGAILALSAGGSILASVAVPAVATAAPAAHVTTVAASPNTYYRG